MVWMLIGKEKKSKRGGEERRTKRKKSTRKEIRHKRT
jgi:hypothetical protein